MTRTDKLHDRLFAGPIAAISFREFEKLLQAFGFELVRTRGSHRNYKHPDVPAILSVQPRGKEAVSTPA